MATSKVGVTAPFLMCAQDGVHEWCAKLLVRGLDVYSGLEQRFHLSEISALRRFQECNRVGLSGRTKQTLSNHHRQKKVTCST